MLVLLILSLFGLALLELILLGAQALSNKNGAKGGNLLFTIMHVIAIFTAVSLIVLYIK